MKEKKLVHLMLVLTVILSLLIVVGGCVPGGSDKSGDSDTKTTTENEDGSEVSPIPKIGQDQPYYNFYNKVAINQTKAEVASALGVAGAQAARCPVMHMLPSRRRWCARSKNKTQQGKTRLGLLFGPHTSPTWPKSA